MSIPAEDRFTAPHTDMRTRIVSGAVMLAAVSLATALGGPVFSAAMAIVAALVAYEWTAVTRLTGPGPLRAIRPVTIGIVAAAVFAVPLDPMIAVSALLIAIACAAVIVLLGRRFLWLPAGIAYAGLPAMALIALRGGDHDGLIAVLYLVAVVSATDSLAYFVGRKVGGPRLWPRVSPKKTWSGLVGGLAGGVLAGALVAAIGGYDVGILAALAGLFALVSQGGDLLESAIKRLFGAKDSGTMIPGHGGVMDRVDGLVAAALLAAAIGILRAGGLEAVGSGLMLW